MGEGNGYRTFIGPGFGTLVPPIPESERNGVPPVISRRGTLRRSMPAVYHETDFAMRFVGSLEGVLDPIAAVLDSLPEHFSPDYAPSLVIDMLAAWLGAELDEAQDLEERREHVRRASELGRRRGTVKGMELALRLSFPEIPTRVEDDGGVRWSLESEPPAKVGPARFVVFVDIPVPEERQLAIARCIERHKPVHADYRLRIKARASGGAS